MHFVVDRPSLQLGVPLELFLNFSFSIRDFVLKCGQPIHTHNCCLCLFYFKNRSSFLSVFLKLVLFFYHFVKLMLPRLF